MSRINYSNRGGWPCLETTGANLTSTDLTYTFAAHNWVNNFFQGGFFVKINNTFTPPSTAVPIYFETTGVPGTKVALTGFGGAAITTAKLQNTGIIECFYDRVTNTLQLLTGITNV